MKILVVNNLLEQKHLDLIKKQQSLMEHKYHSIKKTLIFPRQTLMPTSYTVLHLPL